MSSIEYVAPSWDEIYAMLLDLAAQIRRSGFYPDCIVGVSRGGWAPARVMSDLLENTNTANIKVEFYTGIGETARRPVITQPVSSTVQGKRVLVVDDVSDTGQSLKVIMTHLKESDVEQIRSATIFYKPHSVFKPDFFTKETSAWIIFPWERLESVRYLLEKAKAESLGPEWVKRLLVDRGLDPKVVEQLMRFAGAS